MADTAVFFNLLKVSCSVVVVGGGVLLMVRVSAAHTLDFFFFFYIVVPFSGIFGYVSVTSEHQV